MDVSGYLDSQFVLQGGIIYQIHLTPNGIYAASIAIEKFDERRPFHGWVPIYDELLEDPEKTQKFKLMVDDMEAFLMENVL